MQNKDKIQNETLTGKNPGPMGPPGIPSFGGICPSGLGAGPAFYETKKKRDVKIQIL